MGVSNFTRSQRRRIEARLCIVDERLSSLTKLGVEFKCVTYLARYLAVEITTSERNSLIDRLGGQAEIAISPHKVCVPATLLKSKVYRARLDAWMVESNPSKDPRQAYELELEYKLNRLSNKYQILEDDNFRLQEILAETQLGGPPRIHSDYEAGFMMADKLINQFSELCIVEAGALKERLVTKPTILDPELYALYLEWKGREL